MGNRNLVQVAKDAFLADSVGRTKTGDVVLRKGSFYRMGKSAETFKAAVIRHYMDHGIEIQVVDFGAVYKDFRGGASVARSSHWFVVIREKEEEK